MVLYCIGCRFGWKKNVDYKIKKSKIEKCRQNSKLYNIIMFVVCDDLVIIIISQDYLTTFLAFKW